MAVSYANQIVRCSSIRIAEKFGAICVSFGGDGSFCVDMFMPFWLAVFRLRRCWNYVRNQNTDILHDWLVPSSYHQGISVLLDGETISSGLSAFDNSDRDEPLDYLLPKHPNIPNKANSPNITLMLHFFGAAIVVRNIRNNVTTKTGNICISFFILIFLFL